MSPRAALAPRQASRCRSARASADSLAGQLYDTQQVPVAARSQLPSEEVSDYIQRRGNCFPELEEAADELWRRARLDSDELYHGLVRHVTEELGISLYRSASLNAESSLVDALVAVAKALDGG